MSTAMTPPVPHYPLPSSAVSVVLARLPLPYCSDTDHVSQKAVILVFNTEAAETVHLALSFPLHCHF